MVSNKLKSSNIVLNILGILLTLCISGYLVFELGKINQATLEKKAIADTVTTIMNNYNCDNQEIREAILETFDPVLIAIVIGIESEYHVNAISRAGCRGLMQLSPDKLEDWKDIHKNIQTGARYLEEQIKRFGDLELAIAAYNAGPEAVNKYKGIPPFRETIQYVKKAKLLSANYNYIATVAPTVQSNGIVMNQNTPKISPKNKGKNI